MPAFGTGDDGFRDHTWASKHARLSASGLFLKAPKPGQDRRIDLPTVGVQTIRRVADAGLAGLVIAAGGVICLDLPAMIAEANAKNLFLWARG